MPSFDIVSEVDRQELKNAIDQGKVPQQMFAFKLGDNAEGELTFGGYGK